ncbi:hypothetical protein LCGC14_1129040 [marine sediment metagenome]|uniref:Uncharacterized protein n=1 Tax=marine sediment metagenome TaxID=412755 RepID=A0A0F9Q7I8_9ZZZZ
MAGIIVGALALVFLGFWGWIIIERLIDGHQGKSSYNEYFY